MPIMDASLGACLGIIDVEGWRPGQFSDAAIAAIINVAKTLGNMNLLWPQQGEKQEKEKEKEEEEGEVP